MLSPRTFPKVSDKPLVRFPAVKVEEKGQESSALTRYEKSHYLLYQLALKMPKVPSRTTIEVSVHFGIESRLS